MKRIAFDFSKLKGRIQEKLDTPERFAAELGVSVPALIKKLNNKSQFNQSEIDKSRILLEIPNDELDQYFFSKKS